MVSGTKKQQEDKKLILNGPYSSQYFFSLCSFLTCIGQRDLRVYT
ncbi:Uncharacterised protein [Klebsiella variicola]|nr:hypothetical protein [Klebsiella variicola]SLO50237.1 Uncharacterised protein [Klebsiella variicola]VAR86220.1 Uncharacterised protein [Klebsiella variicola]